MANKSASCGVMPLLEKVIYSKRSDNNASSESAGIDGYLIARKKTVVARPHALSTRSYLLFQNRAFDDRQIKTKMDGVVMGFNEALLKSFLLDTKGLSPKNVNTIMRNLSTVQRAWGVTEPTKENALALKAALRDKGRSDSSIRQYLWALRYWAMAYGSDIDFKEVPLPKPVKTEPKILDFEVVGRIIGDEGLSLRDRIIVMLFSITACRCGELASTKITDIDHKEKTILLHDTKTRKDKKAPIPPRYYTLLSVYLEERVKYLAHIGGKTDALVICSKTWKDKAGNLRYDLSDDGIRQAIYRISERYGIDEPAVPGQRRKRVFHPHTLRHTATTKLMEVLGNPEEVMRITGHSTSAMLDWYSHPRMESIKAKMEAFKY